MNRQVTMFFMVVASLFAAIYAECPNACSAHGKCGAYDMCTCYRNWMSSDCSERICQFGLAHVDIPKGDLNADGAVDMEKVVVNDFIYPYGTTELYAAQADASCNVLTNTAHEYRECSAKGICDRSTGTCTCFEGYEGSACQRASCPSNAGGVCSGHGTCQTIKEIAAADNGNIYRLWDEDSTMGCVCDGGYTGPDCSQRQCKYGVDPLYSDNNATIRYSNWTFGFYTTTTTVVTGNYSLIFYDAYGEDWQTDPIPITANCDTLTDIIESLPNDVIPAGSVRCYQATITTLVSPSPIVDSNVQVVAQYTIAFPKNPGKLPQIDINPYLDGTRSTLYTKEQVSTLGWYVYPNGFTGEDTDFVNNRCKGVTVNILSDADGAYLGGFTSEQARLLKTCLGDADANTVTNQDVYNWDVGTAANNPHLIKLQDATQYQLPARYCPDNNCDFDVDESIYVMPKTLLCTSIAGNPQRFGSVSGVGYCANRDAPGFYAAVYYDTTDRQFRLLTNPHRDYGTTTSFYVYTTNGYLNAVSTNAGVFTTMTSFSTQAKASQYFNNLLFLTNTSTTYTNYFGDLSCENNPNSANGVLDCLNKNDKVLILHPTDFTKNPTYPNIYTVAKLSVEEKTYSSIFPNPTSLQNRLQIRLDYSMNVDYQFTGAATTVARVYKFHTVNPVKTTATNYGYTYAGPCSQRGNCNLDNGQCECYNGYTNDNCDTLNALAQ